MERRREPVWKRPTRRFSMVSGGFHTQVDIMGGIVVRMKTRTGIEEVLVVISATCGRAVIWLARTGLTRPLLRVKLPNVRTLAERQD